MGEPSVSPSELKLGLSGKIWMWVQAFRVRYDAITIHWRQAGRLLPLSSLRLKVREHGVTYRHTSSQPPSNMVPRRWNILFVPSGQHEVHPAKKNSLLSSLHNLSYASLPDSGQIQTLHTQVQDLIIVTLPLTSRGQNTKIASRFQTRLLFLAFPL